MEQNNSNHSQFVTGYHRVLAFLLLVGLIGSIVNMVESVHTDNLYSASLLVLLFVVCILIAWYARTFPLKAQDRAIRAEENFRHYILTGKQLPSNLKPAQIVALRFACDEEFPELTVRTLQENLTAKEVKSAIKNWKADYHRV
jgi:hypothetical protein